MSVPNEPDFSKLPAVREHLEMSIAAAEGAVRLLREAGCPEAAADFERIPAYLRSWTGPDGYLTHYEKGAGS